MSYVEDRWPQRRRVILSCCCACRSLPRPTLLIFGMFVVGETTSDLESVANLPAIPSTYSAALEEAAFCKVKELFLVDHERTPALYRGKRGLYLPNTIDIELPNINGLFEGEILVANLEICFDVRDERR